MSSVTVEIRPYKNKELRSMYGMDGNEKAFKRMTDKWLHLTGKRQGQFWDTNQVKILFEKCGVPGTFLADELESKKNNHVK